MSGKLETKHGKLRIKLSLVTSVFLCHTRAEFTLKAKLADCNIYVFCFCVNVCECKLPMCYYLWIYLSPTHYTSLSSSLLTLSPSVYLHPPDAHRSPLSSFTMKLKHKFQNSPKLKRSPSKTVHQTPEERTRRVVTKSENKVGTLLSRLVVLHVSWVIHKSWMCLCVSVQRHSH